MRSLHRLLLAGTAVLAAAGCIPYSTGTTAAPVERGELAPSMAVYFVPGGTERLWEDSVSGGSLLGVDMEVRYGIDDRSDLGLRVPGFAGIVLDYKRRVTSSANPAAPAVAVLLGTGVVNAGDHALFEAALLASGRQSDRLTPYGGFKAMHVLPLTSYAVSDDPTVGVFGGVRIGTERLGVSPEIAVFHDRSALGLRSGNVIVVPSLTIHGSRLLDLLFGMPSPFPGPRGRW